MYFAPHKLYKQESSPTLFDRNDNPIPETGGEQWKYICDCFLHDITTSPTEGFAGSGISPSCYVNADRRDDLKETDRIKVVDKKNESTVMAEGTILRIKRTSGFSANYITIYI